MKRVSMLLSLSCCRLVLPTATASWIDPDTPLLHHQTNPLTEGDKREFRLVSSSRRRSSGLICLLPLLTTHTSHCNQVFSDEFEQDGRTFHDGQDPRWTAINKNDCKEEQGRGFPASAG